ncbi:MAG: thioredoxin family protein [Fidelibacterota bacterium]|nr:MAG: thioredoxin family protein [Candidatus Neomarinimicrobiota bacterium]
MISTFGLSNQGCASDSARRGQFFPELANPAVCGTILFFFTENLEFYQPGSEDNGATNQIDYLIRRLQLDLSRLSQKYTDVRVRNVDMLVERHVALDHRVFGIPTVIFFDGKGYEVRRWIPDDFKRGGGTMWEFEELIARIHAQNE